MENKSRLFVYSAIIKALRTKPMKFNDLLSKVETETEIHDEFVSFSQRTFQRYIKDIDSLFSIEIKCNGYNEYYIESQENFGSFDSRLFEHFNVFSAMSQLKKIDQTVFTENRCQQGSENMFAMVHAILNNLKVSFVHQKYWETGSTNRTVNPYALKESMGRWYLVAQDGSGKFKTFGLDRITDFVCEKRTFKRENIDLEKMFEACYGIINPDDEPIVEVKLAFDNLKASYLHSYPLHRSQKQVDKDDKQTIFTYQLRITHDLIMAVLSHGCEVRVLSPQGLKNEVQDIARKMLGY
jgi:hypothetical protein